MKKLSLATAVVLMLCVHAVQTFCQKLPNVQANGLRAPLNIRIDGKDLEWSGQFQAHNNSTNLSYTLCNDDTNLYLAIQITTQDALTKFMAGGLTLLVQKSGSKTDVGATGLVYPFYNDRNRVTINLRRKGEVPPPPELADRIADSVMRSNNDRISKGIKFVKLIGITGLDSVLSVYNEDGIKATGFFDNKKAYTCELAIPLKYMGLDITTSPKFWYHILLNGGKGKFTGEGMMKIISGTDRDGNPMSRDVLDAQQARMDAITANMYSTTDFWGEYVLAKK